MNKLLLIPLVLLVTCISFCWYQSKVIAGWDKKYSELTAQFNYLESRSKELQAKTEEAKKQADIKVKNSEKEIQKIMLEPVSKKCEEAIQWGIQKAKSL